MCDPLEYAHKMDAEKQAAKASGTAKSSDRQLIVRHEELSNTAAAAARLLKS